MNIHFTEEKLHNFLR